VSSEGKTDISKTAKQPRQLRDKPLVPTQWPYAAEDEVICTIETPREIQNLITAIARLIEFFDGIIKLNVLRNAVKMHL